MAIGRPPKVDRGRLWQYYSPEPNSGCWIWLEGLNSSGYGPHRKVYEIFKGTIPKDKDIEHLCETRCCINPDHLQPANRTDNMRRSRTWAKDQLRKAAHMQALKRSKTTCPKGHNLAQRVGRRRCMVCYTERRREREDKRALGLWWHHCSLCGKKGTDKKSHGKPWH